MNTPSARVIQKIEEIKRDFGPGILHLLHQANQTFLQAKGLVSPTAKVDRNNIRWTLAWQDGALAFDLNVVISIDDDGKQARVGRVWLHRHAASTLAFEGHTPTTRMKRLTKLSLPEIKEAIELEFK
jgi:hypothetical protein